MRSVIEHQTLQPDMEWVDTSIVSFEEPASGRRVELVGMVHIGDYSYYQTLQKRIDAFDADGFEVHYELVKADKTPLSKKFIRALPGDLAEELGLAAFAEEKQSHLEPSKVPSGKLGTVTGQMRAMEYKEHWQRADISRRDMTPAYRALVAGVRGVSLGFIAGKSLITDAESLADRADRLDEKYAKELTARRARPDGAELLAPRSIEFRELSASSQATLGGYTDAELLESRSKEEITRLHDELDVEESNDLIDKIIQESLLPKHLILDKRNAVALSELDASIERDPNADVVMMWGQAHIPGIKKGLEARGYQLTHNERIRAFHIPTAAAHIENLFDSFKDGVERRIDSFAGKVNAQRVWIEERAGSASRA